MEQGARAEIFVQVVRQGGFSAAARVLGLTGSAVSKQVQLLESALGVKLLNRTTRQVSLTEAGQLYYDRMARIVEEMHEIEAMVGSFAAVPKGSLRLCLPQGFGHLYLKPAIIGFAQKYPAITLHTYLTDRFVDLQAEGFDLAIRIGALEDSALVARKLCSAPMLMVASPAYLAEYGTPQTPQDLPVHRHLAYSNRDRPLEWRYRDLRGKRQKMMLPAVFFSDSGEMLLEAALAGMGIAQLPTFYTQKHLQIGNLQALLTEYPADPERGIYALMPPSRHVPLKLRVFLDYMTAYLKKRPF